MGVDAPADSFYAFYDHATVKSSIDQNQRIIGVHGTYRTDLGGLRSLSFTLANQVHVLSSQEYKDRIEDQFKVKTKELNADKSLISELTV